MAKGKCKSPINNSYKSTVSSPQPRYTTIASYGCCSTLEVQDDDHKYDLMKMMEGFKDETSESLI